METLSDVLDRQYDMERSAFLLDRLDDLDLLSGGEKFKLHVVVAVQEMLRSISCNEPLELWTLSQTIKRLTNVDFDKVNQVSKRKLNKAFREIERVVSNGDSEH